MYLQRVPECDLLRMGIASQPETRMGPLPLRALFPTSLSVFGSVCVHRSTFLLSAWPPECELAHLCPRRPLKVRLSRFLLLFLTLSGEVDCEGVIWWYYFITQLSKHVALVDCSCQMKHGVKEITLQRLYIHFWSSSIVSVHLEPLGNNANKRKWRGSTELLWCCSQILYTNNMHQKL